MIYADHAATTKISETAKLAMLSAMEKDWYNPSSLYTPGQQASGTLMDARVRIAHCLGCLPKEIYFTSGGSEADNQAILSAAAIGKRQGKMHIISTAFEHHAVLHTLKKLEKEGFEITLLDVGEKGIVSPVQVEKAIRPDTILVTVMYANNEIGTIQPIREIGAICRKNGVLFHTDAVQAAGHLQWTKGNWCIVRKNRRIFDQSDRRWRTGERKASWNRKFACNCRNGSGIRGSLLTSKRALHLCDKAS